MQTQTIRSLLSIQTPVHGLLGSIPTSTGIISPYPLETMQAFIRPCGTGVDSSTTDPGDRMLGSVL